MEIFKNRTDLLVILGGIFLALFILGLLVVYFFRLKKRETQISNRLENLTLTPFKTSAVNARPQIISREVSGSLFNRTISTWFRKLLEVLGRLTPANRLLELEHKFTLAGNPGGLHAREFFITYGRHFPGVFNESKSGSDKFDFYTIWSSDHLCIFFLARCMAAWKNSFSSGRDQ